LTGNIVARRYAKALFALGAKKGEAELVAYGQDLAQLAEVLKASPQLYGVFANPIFGLKDKKAVLEKVLDKLSASQVVRNFSMLLADKNRLAYLSDIGSVYAMLLDEAQGIMRGKVLTAVALPEKRQGEIKQKLEKQTGRKLVLGYDVDPGIIGGLVLQIGDKVLDASLKAQLSKMKEQIKRGE
jgi:F-type H+-transporting ATPase subunit delta